MGKKTCLDNIDFAKWTKHSATVKGGQCKNGVTVHGPKNKPRKKQKPRKFLIELLNFLNCFKRTWTPLSKSNVSFPLFFVIFVSFVVATPRDTVNGYKNGVLSAKMAIANCL